MSFPFKIKKISTLGDGSCLVHSIVQCIWPQYKNLSYREKSNFVRNIRQELSNLIDEKGVDGKSYYDRLSRGQLKELSKNFTETEKKEMKRFLKSNEYFSHLYLEFLSEVFEIDIYIIDYNTMDLYNTGDEELLYKKRNSILIGYDENSSHFESLEVEIRPGKYETFFEPESNIIKNLTSQKTVEKY